MTEKKSTEWDRERLKAKTLEARVIPIPETGESERVPVASVLARKVWFKTGGLYIMRDGETVQYLGLTCLPLRSRFVNAINRQKTWTRADYQAWTVTMQRTPNDGNGSVEDLALEFRLTAQYAPRYNIRGRPRKRPLGSDFEGDGDDGSSNIPRKQSSLPGNHH